MNDEHQTDDASDVGSTEPRQTHEPNTFNVRMAVYSGIGLAVLCIGTLILTAGVYRGLTKQTPEDETHADFVYAQQQQTDPKLRFARTEEVDQTRREAEQLLHSYEWIDEDKGIARVPISRAMEMVLEEGLPARE